MLPDTSGSAVNGSELYMGHPSPNVEAVLGGLIGTIDELMFFERAISWCELRAIHRAGSEGVCRDDADTDGVVDYADNCPLISNPSQADLDFDSAGDLCDCRGSDDKVYRAPGEVGGLRVGADLLTDRIGWCPEDHDCGSDTVYTIVRGLLSELPVGSGQSEICLATALDATRYDDTEVLPANTGFWYIVRANNDCGVGTYGFDSGGNERPGPISETCPTTEEELCWATGGVWDPWSCGHYYCGVEPDCDAIIPGCNCGAGKNFEPGLGCVEDPECP
jgi:hypothetical protein